MGPISLFLPLRRWIRIKNRIAIISSNVFGLRANGVGDNPKSLLSVTDPFNWQEVFAVCEPVFQYLEMLLYIQRRIITPALDASELGTGLEYPGAVVNAVTEPGVAQGFVVKDIADIEVHAKVEIIQ